MLLLVPVGARARVAAAVVIGLAAFSLHREAIVRADAGHATIFFGTAAGFAAAMAYGRRRLVAVATLAVSSVVAIVSAPSRTPPNFNPSRT